MRVRELGICLLHLLLTRQCTCAHSYCIFCASAYKLKRKALRAEAVAEAKAASASATLQVRPPPTRTVCSHYAHVLWLDRPEFHTFSSGMYTGCYGKACCSAHPFATRTLLQVPQHRYGVNMTMVCGVDVHAYAGLQGRVQFAESCLCMSASNLVNTS